MSVTRVRVELRHKHGEANDFKGLLAAFKKEVGKCGVIQDYRLKQTYESPARKRRRKMRQSEVERLKQVVKDQQINNKN